MHNIDNNKFKIEERRRQVASVLVQSRIETEAIEQLWVDQYPNEWSYGTIPVAGYSVQRFSLVHYTDLKKRLRLPERFPHVNGSEW